MAKYTDTPIDQLSANEQSAIRAINKNLKDIQAVLENTVSRDGTVPNAMDANIDMNGYKILNVAEPTEDTDLVRYKDVNGIVDNIKGIAEDVNQAAEYAKSAATDAERKAQEVIQQLQNLDRDSIVKVANNINNILAVKNIQTSIVGVAGISDKIETVAPAAQSINTVASNIASVNTNAANISVIQSASSNATTASTAAAQSTTNKEHSKIWAEGTDQEVSSLGGTHSAKVWQQLASEVSRVDNATESKAGISRLATESEATSGTIDTAVMTPLKTKKAIQAGITGKQDIISDLASIRSGAGKGATALQSITKSNVTTALGYTPYNSTNPNGYITGITSTQVTNALGFTPAPVDSPNFTTVAYCPTVQTPSDNSTKIANTAFIANKFQVVDEKPSTTVPGTFYLVRES